MTLITAEFIAPVVYRGKEYKAGDTADFTEAQVAKLQALGVVAQPPEKPATQAARKRRSEEK